MPHLQEPAISEEHWAHLSSFYEYLDQIKMEECTECNEKWFDMEVVEWMCKWCRQASGAPPLYTDANNLDVGLVPDHLPELTQIEELLIARVHVHLQVWQVKGQQYKYRSHVVDFMQNTPKIYHKLPLLPRDLDVSGSRPFYFGSVWANSPRLCYSSLHLDLKRLAARLSDGLTDLFACGDRWWPRG